MARYAEELGLEEGQFRSAVVAVAAEHEPGKQEPAQEENTQHARTPVSKHPQHRLAPAPHGTFARARSRDAAARSRRRCRS